MNSFLKELFDYNQRMNQKFIDAFSANPTKISEKSIKLMSHILNAHQIWNNRIDSEEPLFGVWQMQRLENFTEIDQTNHDKTFNILEEFNATSLINYTSSKGEPFKNSIQEIIFHVLNHSTYHRGQISAELRNSGIDPLISDYIFYKREMNLNM